jgi:hypothetical protein
MHTNNKYLLCRPRGGLTDQLCSAGDCLRYAINTGRRLIIDTSHYGLFDSIWNYVYIVSGNDYFDLTLSYRDLDTLSVFPIELNGRISSFSAILRDGDRFISDELTGVPVTFDFDRDYNEALLVHEQGRVFGPDLKASFFLSFLRVQPWLRTIILSRLSMLPEDYFAVHIRNTDYRVPELESRLSLLSKQIPAGSVVLVCSDNESVFASCRSIFFSHRLFRVSTTVSIDGLPLHGRILTDRLRINVDVFTDLFGLAFAKQSFYLPVISVLPDGRSVLLNSGFSILASTLQTDRNLLQSLIQR